MAELRAHHYRFAHRVMPRAAVDFGPTMLAEPPAHGVQRSLESLWDGFGGTLPPEDRLPSDGLSGQHVDRAGHRLLLVTLPEPIAAAEAHFVAVVQVRGEEACRFLTLERSESPVDGSVGTVLGEWSAEGHVNFGAGPAPRPELFLSAIDALLGAHPTR
ncbi:hypothetical protein ACIRBX_25670 [Kitasatospora sp. NPDC096147]|uniref:hypothetical protein n=1 Tax=Kitasatospora sp. NPDC096147 TaxID=3364093 RepID=UPI0038151401